MWYSSVSNLGACWSPKKTYKLFEIVERTHKREIYWGTYNSYGSLLLDFRFPSGIRTIVILYHTDRYLSFIDATIGVCLIAMSEFYQIASMGQIMIANEFIHPFTSELISREIITWFPGRHCFANVHCTPCILHYNPLHHLRPPLRFQLTYYIVDLYISNSKIRQIWVTQFHLIVRRVILKTTHFHGKPLYMKK